MLIVCFCDSSRGWVAVVGLLALCSVYLGLFWAILRHCEGDLRVTFEELESQIPRRKA